jgi:hypothetical protein
MVRRRMVHHHISGRPDKSAGKNRAIVIMMTIVETGQIRIAATATAIAVHHHVARHATERMLIWSSRSLGDYSTRLPGANLLPVQHQWTINWQLRDQLWPRLFEKSRYASRRKSYSISSAARNCSRSIHSSAVCA